MANPNLRNRGVFGLGLTDVGSFLDLPLQTQFEMTRQAERDQLQADALQSWMSGETGGGTTSSGTTTASGTTATSTAGDGTQDNRFAEGLTSAEDRLSSLLDDPESIQQSAAYKFRLSQGQEALNRQLAAKGLLSSGNRLMELTKYGQDMASQEYENQFGRLSGLLGQYAQGYAGEAGNASAERIGRMNIEANKALQEQRLAQQQRQQTLSSILNWA